MTNRMRDYHALSVSELSVVVTWCLSGATDKRPDEVYFLNTGVARLNLKQVV